MSSDGEAIAVRPAGDPLSRSSIVGLLVLFGCGGPTVPSDVPRLAPAGPAAPYLAEPWHRAVVGENIENIEVRVPSGREAGNCAPPGHPLEHYTETVQTGWLLSERIDGAADLPDPAAVCIFRWPSRGLPTVEERPSASDRFTTFSYPDGTFVIAYGPARKRLHDLVAVDPRPPSPLPRAPDVTQWRMRFASARDRASASSPEWSLEWETTAGMRYEHVLMSTEHDADVRARLSAGRAWRRGREMLGARPIPK